MDSTRDPEAAARAALLRRAAIRQDTSSPAALDATLARISAEVEADALDRLRRAAKPS